MFVYRLLNIDLITGKTNCKGFNRFYTLVNYSSRNCDIHSSNISFICSSFFLFRISISMFMVVFVQLVHFQQIASNSDSDND